jgi:hypothetical protein
MAFSFFFSSCFFFFPFCEENLISPQKRRKEKTFVVEKNILYG